MVTDTSSRNGENVVVTGLGISTALGFGVGLNWERMLAGHSAIAIRPAEDFPLPISLPTRLGAAIDRSELAQRIQRAVPRKIWNTSEEVCHLWLLTALEALHQARIASNGQGNDQAISLDRVGVYVGTGGGPSHFIEKEYLNIFTAEKTVRRDVSRMAVPKYMTSSFAGQLSILKGFHGPSLTVNTACSAGATALVMALDAIRLGRIDCAVAGGVDMPVVSSVMKGFYNLNALSKRSDLEGRACRPFDADRDGIVLGEGAACLVLERESMANARGAKPLAGFLGGAATSEAHHLLSPKDDGEEMARTMIEALADGVLPGEQVVHVYAHGTGTRYNDLCEAVAVNRVLPHRPSVSASKAQLGHTIAAGGAIDAVLAVLSLNSGQVLPMFHLERQDPDCYINLARSAPHPALRPGSGSVVLVNSFAFGGHNTSLLFASHRMER